MPVQYLISGFLLGLAGSVHCVGMCGPIAFALPLQFLPTKAQKALGILLYNLGRISTYSILGLIGGFAGRFILIGRFQQWFTVFFGVSIIAVLLVNFVFGKSLHITPLNKIYNRLQVFIAKKINQQAFSSLFVLGMANGLLPCGMVFLAVTGAIAYASPAHSMAYMFLYGLGTFPALFALSYFGFVINLSVRNTVKKMAPYLLGIIAVLLILRGLNLNIPYVSPYFYSGRADGVSCH